MTVFRAHDSATCPTCGERLAFGAKAEASGWKVLYECGERCGWEVMAGWISMASIDHQDEVHERAETMGERWA